jgi:glycosyltransferase involved in cell wall biosynthesis
VERLASNVGADLVVVPHGDELATRLGASVRRVPCQLVLLIMRDPRWERPAAPARWAKNLLKLLLLRRADLRKNVYLVWLRHFGYSGPDRHVVDPYVGDGGFEEIRAAGRALRTRLSLSDNTFWFLVTGAVTDRKNVPLIASALSRLQRAEPTRRLGLAIIGPHRTSYPIDAQSLQALTGGSFPIVSDDRLLSNFEMNAAISGADAVVMAYDTHSPNSTMLKARALGTKLIVAGPPSVRAFARDMGFSSVVQVEVEALAEAMRRELDAPPPQPCPLVPDGDALALGLLRDAETWAK